MKYEFDLNMGVMPDVSCIDMWGCASCVRLGTDYGCEYNYCIDGEYDCSAIYLYFWNEKTEEYETDTSCYRHYEVDFCKDDWADRLKAEMMRFLKENLINEWYYV